MNRRRVEYRNRSKVNMVRRVTSIWIISVILCAAVPAFLGTMDGREITSNDGTLSGYVTDPSMHPIVGARVRVEFHGQYEEDYTDPDGYYHVTNIPICYCLKKTTASKEGYISETELLSIVENTIYDFVLEPYWLSVDTYTISALSGGTVQMYLNAESGHSGMKYCILGSITGTYPGTVLPGGATLPLNWDPFTNLALGLVNSSIFDNFMGTLNVNGQAVAKINTEPIPSGFIGLKMYYAYTLYTGFDFVSNPVVIEIVN